MIVKQKPHMQERHFITNEKMKKENIAQPVVSKLSLRHTKRNKKRILPDVFYLRWELELLSAFVMIFVLVELPPWISFTTHVLFPENETGISAFPITAIANVLIFGFGIYIILRLLWLILIRKHENVSHGRLRFIKEIDQVAELIISIFIILLVIGLFAFMIRLLIIWMQNEILNKTGDVFKMNL
jgi:hypothetical protein